MTRQNNYLPSKFLSVGLFLKLILIASLPTQVQAQVESATGDRTLPSHLIGSVTFDPPKDGKPNETEGGASRGGGLCPQDSKVLGQSVTLLLPTSHYGLTVAQKPTFFIYVPQTSAQKAIFILKDKSEDYYYQKSIPIPATAGVISFNLPTDAPAIELGKRYQWSFVLLCGEVLKPDSFGVNGWIERMELNSNLSSQLNNLSPLERAAWYGRNGIWYDTLTSLAQLRQETSSRLAARPHSSDATLAANWEELLRSVGLGAIATEPLLQ